MASRSGFVICFLITLLLAGFIVLPLLVVTLGSFINPALLGLSSDLWSGSAQKVLDFSAFDYIFQNYGEWALFSLGLALTCVAVCLLVAVPASYVLVRYRFAGSQLIEELVSLPLSLPGITLSMALLACYGELRGPLLVLAGHLLYTIPFMVRVVTSTLRSFDLSRLEAAAQSLGASFWQRLFFVVLPSLRHAMMTGALLVFAVSWGEFNVSFLLNRGRPQTFPAVLYDTYTNQSIQIFERRHHHLSRHRDPRPHRHPVAGGEGRGRRGAGSMNISLEAQGLRKEYGAVTAVHNFSHAFAAGKITALLGPSGSGKSTTLSMIAGLIRPDSGCVRLGGRDITSLPAERRDFGLVFQDYALFPHLTVAENVEFGLRVRGVEKQQRRRQALEALDRVQIGHLANRRVHQVSGGERQRTALARALVINPAVLLLDEPLSALDAKLRESLRSQLGALLRELAITTIFVTHDQVEAMSLADQMIVMQAGRIEQTGSPYELYSRPATPFVATFLGSANLLDAECGDANGVKRLRLPFAELYAPSDATVGPCRVMVRPEDLLLTTPDDGHLHGEVTGSVFLGSQARLTVTAGGYTLAVDTANEAVPSPGEAVSLRIREEKICLMPVGG
jgi:putative spermidine/putrescine transport system ATP-binding protein